MQYRRYGRKTRKRDLFPRIINEIKRDILIILILTAVSGAGSGLFSVLFIRPVYTTDFTVLVETAEGAKSGEVSSKIKNIAGIVISDSVISEAGKNSGISTYKLKKLSKKIKAEIFKDSGRIKITVSGYTAREAYAFATELEACAKDRVESFYDSFTIKSVNRAYIPDSASSPKPVNWGIAGAVTALITALLLVIFKEYSDETVTSEALLKHNFKLPVLGKIPDLDEFIEENSDYYDEPDEADENLLDFENDDELL